MSNPEYGQILFNGCHSNAFKLTLGHNVKQLLVEMIAAAGKDIADHVIRLPEVMPSSLLAFEWSPTVILYTYTSEGFNEKERVEDEVAGRKEFGSSIDVSSDWVNRITYIPHICWVQMIVCEIPNITMNFRSIGVWAHQPKLPWSNWQQSLRMNRRLTNEQGSLRNKRKVRRSAIQIIPVQYWALFATQSTTTLDMGVETHWRGVWILVWFANWSMTKLLGTCIHFRACLALGFWHTWFGQYGSLWADGFAIKICQECWWQMQWATGWCLPQWQWLSYANC